MTTAIELDNGLVERAFKESGAPTEREAVEQALELYLKIRGQAAIRELRGKIQWEGDLHQSRLNRFEDDRL